MFVQGKGTKSLLIGKGFRSEIPTFLWRVLSGSFDDETPFVVLPVEEILLERP